jgi:Uncharacterised protein family UPF0547
MRAKDCPGCGAVLPISTKECSHCDYQFTSKSMLVSQQSALEESNTIREKFPFEPERVSAQFSLKYHIYALCHCWLLISVLLLTASVSYCNCRSWYDLMRYGKGSNVLYFVFVAAD